MAARQKASKPPDPEKEAIARLQAAAFNPAVDAVFEKDPRECDDADLMALVGGLRAERALWQAHQSAKEKRRVARAAKEKEHGEKETWEEEE